MPNADDRRVKMTKKILKEALIEIMHTKPIHEISIKKICETAFIIIISLHRSFMMI